MTKRSFPVPGQGGKKNGVALAEKSKKSTEVSDEQLEAMVGGMSKKTAPPKNPTKPIAQEDMDEEEEWDDDLDEDEDFSDDDEDDDEDETYAVDADDDDEEEEEEEPAPPPRKGPGRPPKSEAVVKPAADQKRGPGRPKKVQEEEDETPAPKPPKQKSATPEPTAKPAQVDAIKLLTEQVASLTTEVANLKKAVKSPAKGEFTLGSFFQALADHFTEQ